MEIPFLSHFLESERVRSIFEKSPAGLRDLSQALTSPVGISHLAEGLQLFQTYV